MLGKRRPCHFSTIHKMNDDVDNVYEFILGADDKWKTNWKVDRDLIYGKNATPYKMTLL